MPDFGPYLIFRLYLSRMQKYAFFPVCANILGEFLLPPAFFLKKLFGPRACRLIRKWSDSTWTHGKNNFHNFYNNEQKSGN